jgi:prophage antirepressor-like protein
MAETKKGAAGAFEFWHVGYMAYEVRRNGVTLAKRTNLSQAAAEARRLYEIEKQDAETMNDFNYVGSRHHY